jgi:hypothetical protein
MMALEVAGMARTRDYLARAEQQMPYALSLALNRTASAIVRAVRDNVRARFVLRTPYVLEEVQQLRWADKARGNVIGHPRNAEVAVPGLAPGQMGAAVGLHPNPKGGQSHRNPILERFETGRPKTGGVAIPTTRIRPSFRDLAPRQMYPKNLGLEARRFVEARYAHAGTKFGAFVFGRPGTKAHGIWARWPGPDLTTIGSRFVKGQVRRRNAAAATHMVKLWNFRAGIPIPARLGFRATAQTVGSRLGAELRRALDHALRTAR